MSERKLPVLDYEPPEQPGAQEQLPLERAVRRDPGAGCLGGAIVIVALLVVAMGLQIAVGWILGSDDPTVRPTIAIWIAASIVVYAVWRWMQWRRGEGF